MSGSIGWEDPLPAPSGGTDAICDAFEAKWLAGGRPRIEDFLLLDDVNHQTDLLRELLLCEWDLCRRQRHTIELATYQARFPNDSSFIASLWRAWNQQWCEAATASPADVTGPAMADGRHELPGTMIDRYELVEKIGEGGFGDVWAAEQREPVRRRVALKIIKLGMDTKQIVARFEAERQALAMMDHPNIATVLDAGTTATGRPYFVMELVTGANITEYCDQSQLDIRARLRLFVEICNGVQHAHQKGIIHRDLKPSNVLVANCDNLPMPKVIDFGLAKVLNQTLTDKTIVTRWDQLLGTLDYMSPEQTKLGQLDVDTRSDVYSLGVLLYELLTGTLPFDRKRLNWHGFDRAMQIIREEDPPKPSTRVNSGENQRGRAADRKLEPRGFSRALRGDLDWIVMKALDKERSNRYQAVAAFAADINRHLDDLPIEARRLSELARAWKWTRRRPAAAALVLVSACAALALAGTGIMVSYYARLEVKNTELAAAFARTDTALARASFHEYFHHLARARTGWVNGNIVQVNERLDACAPERRDFEWRYLKRLCHTDLLTLDGHSASVNSVAFSSDGRWIASGSDDKTIQIWDAITGRRVRTLAGHGDQVTHVAFSPDGSRLASAGFDRNVKIWDVATASVEYTLAGHHAEVTSVAFRPDGKLLASTARDATVRTWDLTTGRELGEPMYHDHFQVFNVVYSPDGNRLVSVGYDGVIRIWDATSGRALGELGDSGAQMNCVAFHPDGTSLATSGFDRNIRVWDLDTGQIRQRFHSPTPVFNLAFNPDGTRLATGGVETVLIWNLTAESQPPTIRRGHHGSVNSLAFSPDGARLATAGTDGMVRVWDVDLSQEHQAPIGHSDEVRGVAFHPDGNLLATASNDKTVRIWNVTTGQEVRAIHCDSGVTSVAYHPDGRRLATAASDKCVSVWDSITGARISEKLLDDSASGVAFSADGRLLAAVSIGGAVKVWSWADDVEIPGFHGHSAFVWGAVFSPGGNQLATASKDRTVKIWEVTSGQLLQELRGHTAFAHHRPAFHPNGSQLAASGVDQTIIVWDLKTGSELRRLKGHSRWPISMAFSPDGNRLASVGWDFTLRIWDAATSQEALVLTCPVAVYNLAFSPDGNRLAVTGDKAVLIFDARPWTPEAAWEREAVSLLEHLFRKPLSKTDVVDYLQDGATVRPESRELALALVDSYQEVTDPEQYDRASWRTASKPHLNLPQYRFALMQAETACRMARERTEFLAALAVAQYRVGQQQQALATLAKLRDAATTGNGARREILWDKLRQAEAIIEADIAESDLGFRVSGAR